MAKKRTKKLDLVLSEVAKLRNEIHALAKEQAGLAAACCIAQGPARALVASGSVDEPLFAKYFHSLTQVFEIAQIPIPRNGSKKLR